MSFRDVLRTFADLYLETSVDESTDENNDAEVLAEMYAFHRTHLTDNKEVMAYHSEGLFINQDDFRKRIDSLWDIHRGYMISEEPVAHILPEVFQEFRKYFPKGAQLRGTNMEFIPTLGIMQEELANPPEPVVDPLSTTCDEWICFFRDGHSVDNGNGAIYINANPKSEYYGRLAIMSSCDDMVIMITQFQFDDFIEILIANSEMLHTMRDGDYKRSIVDFFNTFQVQDSENFNCKAHFENRANAVKQILNESIPPGVSSIIADYITYVNIPEYQPIYWGDDKEYMLRAGATEEMWAKQELSNIYV